MPAISLMAVSWIAGPAVNAATSAVPKTTYVGARRAPPDGRGHDQHPMCGTSAEARRALITTDPREFPPACISLTPLSPSQTIGATGFFVFSLVAGRVGAHDHRQEGNVAIIVLDAGLGIFKAPAWTTNACEWTLAFIVIAFHAALAADLSAKGARLTLVTTAAKAKGEAPLVAPLVAA